MVGSGGLSHDRGVGVQKRQTAEKVFGRDVTCRAVPVVECE